MEASYQGIRKPFALTVYDPSDRERVLPILEELSGRGLALCYGAPATKKLLRYACAVIVFLSPAAANSEAVNDAILLTQAEDRPMVTVQLEPASLSETLKRILYTKHTIDAGHAPEVKELADRIMTAESLKKPELTKAQKDAAKGVAIGLFAVAAAVVALAAVFLLSRFTGGETQQADADGPAGVGVVLPAGITEKDLLSIQSLTLLGDTIIEMNAKTTLTEEPEYVEKIYDIIDEQWDEQGNREWYYLGKRYERGTITDLSLIGQMKNLRQLNLFHQGRIDLTPLASLPKLDSIEIDGCLIDDITPLSALTNLVHLGLKDNQVSDLSPLSACTRLDNVYMGRMNNWSLDGLGPNIRTVEIWGMPELTDVNALKNCTKLQYLRLNDMPQLADLSPLSGITTLQDVTVQQCPQLRDLSPLAASTKIRFLEVTDGPVADLSFVSGFTGIETLSVHNTNLRNLDFLDGVTPFYSGLTVRCDERITDYSGLAFQKEYAGLELWMDNRSYETAVQPYLAEAEVMELKVCHCTNLDLAALPKGLMQLDVQNVPLTDLTGIGNNETLINLTLCNMDRLSSLSGLEGLKGSLYLTIENCPRLTDTEALYTTGLLERLDVRNDGFIPDFTRLNFGSDHGVLELDNAYGVRDLTGFTALPEAEKANLWQLAVKSMDWLTDLRPIACLTKLKHLTVPYQLEEQTEEVTAGMDLMSLEIAYPTGEWRQDDSNLTLLSLEELDTLPDAVLGRVGNACIVGDQVVDTETMEYRSDWKNNKPMYYIAPREGDDSEKHDYVGKGSIDSMDRLQKLTNIRWLNLVDQPLTSLEGVQNLSNLQGLTVSDCPVTDASPVFALTELEQVELGQTDITSIQGVQNLTRLRRLDIGDTKVTDLSPLAACDFSAAVEEGGLELNVSGIACKDFVPLSAVEAYRGLHINDVPAQYWLPHLAGKRVEGIFAASISLTDGDIPAFAALTGLKQLHIPWNQKVTDLTPLLAAPELEDVKISRDMEQAMESLSGKDCRFRLEIEG